jgi:hypothetical protein
MCHCDLVTTLQLTLLVVSYYMQLSLIPGQGAMGLEMGPLNAIKMGINAPT